MRRSPTQIMSSSSPIARHLRFHFSSTESSLTPVSTKEPSWIPASLHLKPQFGCSFFDCRVSSTSAVTGSSSTASSSAPASAVDSDCRARTTSLITSCRTCSRSSSASLLEAQMPLGPGLGLERAAASTWALPRLRRSFRSALLPPRSSAPLPSACSSSSSSGAPAGGAVGSPDAMAGVTPSAPTACPASAGRSREMSRKGSSRSDTLPQPQHSVAAKMWPRKLLETHTPQEPGASSAGGFPPASLACLSSALVVSSEIEPSRVRSSSCASCCSFPLYQGNLEINSSRSALGLKAPLPPCAASVPRMPWKTAQRERGMPSRP
mmetsp:Transcript_48374/g.149455  ORF Transcript_48374/g.149455 Transcript_48374/m.149455 type:complete len:322 (+) Transcript_48374:980-1945(+)